jgi:hypothetical protein
MMAKRKSTSTLAQRRTQRDNREVEDRVRETGRVKALEMQERFSEVGARKEDLWQWGYKLAKRTGMDPPDRTARRMKVAVACWFVKEIPDFPEGFSPLDDPEDSPVVEPEDLPPDDTFLTEPFDEFIDDGSYDFFQ